METYNIDNMKAYSHGAGILLYNAFDGKDYIYLAYEYKEKHDEFELNDFGGKRECINNIPETTKECAIRELYEESGLRLRFSELRDSNKIVSFTGIYKHINKGLSNTRVSKGMYTVWLVNYGNFPINLDKEKKEKNIKVLKFPLEIFINIIESNDNKPTLLYDNKEYKIGGRLKRIMTLINRDSFK